jgi:uncharacterized protein YjbJ (UPF0337 family)
MSIASDIRSYADTAVSQGKQVLDQAQAQLNDVTGQANEFVGKARENVSDIAEKATEAVNDLRTSAEKAVNLDAIKTAVEPYLAQVKTYSAAVTDKAEVLFHGIKTDKRVAKLVDTAGSVTGVVLETVQDRVVKPVQSLTGLGGKPAAKPAAPKAAATKPAAKPVATKPAPSKPASRPAARKAPAKRTKA